MREVTTAVGNRHDDIAAISADRVWQCIPAAVSDPVDDRVVYK